MNEIKEIMNGNVKIFNMRVEGETIGFDTPYNSNWNFMPRDFEQIIDTLQQENARLKDKIEKSIMYIENTYDDVVSSFTKDKPMTNFKARKELLDILKEN